jgi:hypothetical protein
MKAKGYTGLSISRLYTLKSRVEEGKLIGNNGAGRPSLASIPELIEFVTEATQGGNTIGSAEMNAKLTEFGSDF